MIDVLLIQPPIRDFYLTAKRTVPYGLACLAAVLEAEGFSVRIVDALASRKSRIRQRPAEMAYLDRHYGRSDHSPFSLFHRYRHYGFGFEKIAALARQVRPGLVGISSLFTAYRNEALETAIRIKKALPRCPIVFGGHHPTQMPEDVMACEAVDYVIRGEGETALPALARALLQGARPDGVPGIVFRKPDGGIHLSEPVLMNPAAQPLPAKHLIDQGFYRRKGGGATVITASRGCPMQCSYCSMGEGAVISYRRRPVDSVLEEMTADIRERGVRFFDFEDENLSLDRKWFLKLLAEIRKRFAGLNVELRAMNGLMPTSLDAESVCAMKVAGFRTLNLSLGTACPDQIRRFRRPDMREAFDSALEWARQNHMDAVGYIIVAGPDQCPERAVDDLLFLARRRVLAGVSVYYPVPGTVDYRRCRQLNILPDFLPLYRSSALPLSHATTRAEAATLLRLARILNFMKAQADAGLSLPEASSFHEDTVLDGLDRETMGRRLLAGFLHDGRIRGVTAEGIVYCHETSGNLCRRFIRGIVDRGIKGVHRIPE